MSTYAVKNQNEKSQSGTKSVSKDKTDSNEFVDFFDQRPESEAQSKVQEIANRSSQSIRLSSFQQKADSNTNNSQPVQLKKYLDLKKGGSEQGPIQGKFIPIQKNENKTGLPDTLKLGMESLSGVSMDDVKVHLNSKKPEALHAHAFAQGTDIHVGPGQEKYLPHEAWHVVQQKQGRVKPTVKVNGDVPVNDSQSLEQEATYMGQKALNSPSQDSQNSLNQASIQTPTAQLWPKWLGGKGDSGPKKEEEKEGMWSRFKSGAGAVGAAVGGGLGAAAGGIYGVGKALTNKIGITDAAVGEEDFKKTVSKNSAIGADYGSNKDNKTSDLIKEKATRKKDKILNSFTTSVSDENRLYNKVTDRGDRIKDGFEGKKTEGHRSFLNLAAGKALGTVGALGGAALGGIKGLYSGYKTSGKGFKNTAKGMFSGAKASGKEWATEGYKKGDQLGAEGVESVKSGVGMAVGAATGTVGALGGAAYGGMKGLYSGYKTSGKGFKNTAKGMLGGAGLGALIGGIQGGAAGYDVGKKATSGLIGLAEELPGAAMDLTRGALGAATGTVGALGGAAYGGAKGLADGYKTSGKGFKNTAKGMFGGAGSGALEGGKDGAKAGFEMGANSKASQYITSKGASKAASYVGNLLLPGSGTGAGMVMDEMTKGYYGKGNKPKGLDKTDIGETTLDGVTKKDSIGHIAGGAGLELPDWLV